MEPRAKALLIAAIDYLTVTDGNIVYTQQQDYLRSQLAKAVRQFDPKEALPDAVGSGDEEVQVRPATLVERVGTEGEEPQTGDSDHAVGEELEQAGVPPKPSVQ